MFCHLYLSLSFSHPPQTRGKGPMLCCTTGAITTSALSLDSSASSNMRCGSKYRLPPPSGAANEESTRNHKRVLGGRSYFLLQHLGFRPPNDYVARTHTHTHTGGYEVHQALPHTCRTETE